MLNNKFVEDTIFSGQFTPTSYKLIIFFLTIIEDMETFKVKRLTHAEMAERIKVNRTNLTTVIKHLTENGILIKRERDYYLNSELFEEQKKD